MNLMPKLSNRKLTLVTLFWILSSVWASLTGFAQSIYDYNFALAIRSACPTCIGTYNNLLPPAASLTRLDVSNRNIADLSGIEGFTSLDTLLCNDNQLTKLPALPKSLTTLSCFNNQLTCLPALPNSLKFLKIDADKVTCLVNSVNGLKVYDAANNLIALPPICTFIPDEGFAETIRRACPDCIGPCDNLLPPAAALTSLHINAYYIQDITGIDNFTSLQSLTINFAQLKSLPTLPNSLKELHCTRTLITSLPALPSNLEVLDLPYNRLTSLPTLPNGLKFLNCSFNQLKSLPTLSENLFYLDCRDNLISNLPILTGKLWSLNCANNQLSCLPFLPSTLKSLSIYGNGITCLPNKVAGLSAYSDTATLLPVCSVPDQNFVKAIKNSCPSCMDSCYRLLPAANSLTALDISNQGITDLTGISLFPALKTLDISNNPLACLPVLPVTLTKLIVNPDEVTCLPKQIPGLQVYNRNGEQIVTPPVCPLYIPDSNFALAIRRACFSCIDACNYLLPPAFTLKSLNVSTGKIANLSGIDQFTSLETLDCSYNLLTELPGLPSSLKSLKCSSNKLISLPSLPVSLTNLECNNNKLEHLPTLPNKLARLSCAGNQLNCLPFLPSALKYLVIANNSKITCLPNKVIGVYIQYNQGIYYLPVCGVVEENFAKALQSDYPNCIDSCYRLLPPASGLTSLNVSNKNIADLTGISAFSALQTLDCSKNQLICLPILPTTLSKLVIDADKIKCLPNYIPGLKVYNNDGELIPTPPVCSLFIPDINFADAIRSVCPSCIDVCNNLLPPADTLKSLDVYGQNISDLTGIGGFISLQKLYCSNNKLTTLPALPSTLIYLECNINQLISLNKLPNSLKLLYCYENKLKNLPTLPDSLRGFSCGNNLLTSLPKLPTNLVYIYCDNNQLTSLPALPPNLSYLYCVNNQLTSLPALPDKLDLLNCENNKLTCLPFLPKSLSRLTVFGNNITCLPNKTGLFVYNFGVQLPICGIADENFSKAIHIDCSACIDSCHKLLPPTSSLLALDVSNKNISDLTGISLFSSLQVLNCSGNQLTCLPTLPTTLTKLIIDADKIKCLPNNIPNLQVYNAVGELIATPPVCENFIRDNYFANIIRSRCSNCIDACNNLLPPVANLTSLDISFGNISDLTGISAFTSLQQLNCRYTQLKILPELPATLTYLDCSYSKLTSLPTLPANLTTLYCQSNQLTCLPTLPNSLRELHIDSEKISCLPNLVPDLKIYNNSNNLINGLPLCPVSLIHPTGSLPPGTYISTQTIESGANLSVGVTNYHAGQTITLKPGFQTFEGRTFSAEVRGCK